MDDRSETATADRPARRRDIRTVLMAVVAVVLAGWALRATSVVAVP